MRATRLASIEPSQAPAGRRDCRLGAPCEPPGLERVHHRIVIFVVVIAFEAFRQEADEQAGDDGTTDVEPGIVTAVALEVEAAVPRLSPAVR